MATDMAAEKSIESICQPAIILCFCIPGMNLFVNDIPVKIFPPGQGPAPGHYNQSLNAQREPITKASLLHHVWITHANVRHLDIVLDLIDSKVPINLLSLALTVDDYESVKVFLKKKYKVIKAAGGLVRKKDRVLMIYRMKKWDLPKGKRDSGEKSRQTAIREVQEECNVTVKMGAKICTTWHTYTMNKKAMLKKTRWYLMDVVDDSKMMPSQEEDIEELRWMTQKEVYHALENSYRSIRFVFEEYYHQAEKVAEK
jgi:8-oxo-dGTP pyrophosphatase MutT (NUDIX family)